VQRKKSVLRARAPKKNQRANDATADVARLRKRRWRHVVRIRIDVQEIHPQCGLQSIVANRAGAVVGEQFNPSPVAAWPEAGCDATANEEKSHPLVDSAMTRD